VADIFWFKKCEDRNRMTGFISYLRCVFLPRQEIISTAFTKINKILKKNIFWPYLWLECKVSAVKKLLEKQV
jgi:hypothetical protein